MKNRRLTVAAMAAVLASGCTPPSLYIAADRATFDAIAPEYVRYVEADATLDDAAKARRQRTVATWEGRLKAAEGAKR